MTNILFICKYNRFRSQVALAYFKKVSKNKKVRADSAGLFMDRPIAGIVKKLGKKYGFDVKGKPKQVSTKLLKWQDIIVIVANNVPKNLFKNWKKRKIIVWKIPDASQRDIPKIEKSMKMIMNKVDSLVKELERKK